MRDVLVHLARAAGAGDDGAALAAIGQAGDLARERGREEQRAPLGGDLAEDRVELVLEAHVEHLVRLVEDDDADLRRVDRPAAEVIEQAARGADDDERPAAQLGELHRHARAAGHDGDAGAQRLEQPAELLRDLGRELARRRDHDDERVRALLRRHAFLRELLERRHRALELGRDAEPHRHGLARARLREDAQVAAGERRIEHRLLDGRERGEAARLEGGAEGLRYGVER